MDPPSIPPRNAVAVAAPAQGPVHTDHEPWVKDYLKPRTPPLLSYSRPTLPYIFPTAYPFPPLLSPFLPPRS